MHPSDWESPKSENCPSFFPRDKSMGVQMRGGQAAKSISTPHTPKLRSKSPAPRPPRPNCAQQGHTALSLDLPWWNIPQYLPHPSHLVLDSES